MALLILTAAGSADIDIDPSDDDALRSLWRRVQFRYESAVDQHAAVADELADFGTEATAFSPDQLWTLARAVKVQHQLLELYAGAAPCVAAP